MKHRTELILALAMTVSVIGCVAVWYIEISWLLYLTVVPFFCAQLLLCRLTGRWWIRIIPALPVAAVLAMAGFYLVRYSGWDALAALILGLVCIAPTVGIILGWLVWWICMVLHKRKQREGA